MRSLECSTAPPLSQLWLLSRLADFSLPPPLFVLLSSPLHHPPSSFPFLHICMLIMGESFLTFGQVWVQVWHQCCTRNFSILFSFLFFLFWSVIEIFWKTLEILILIFFVWLFFSLQFSMPFNAPFFEKLTGTSFRLGWKKWKHRVFKHIGVSRAAHKLVMHWLERSITGAQPATCPRRSNQTQIEFILKQKKKRSNLKEKKQAYF